MPQNAECPLVPIPKRVESRPWSCPWPAVHERWVSLPDGWEGESAPFDWRWALGHSFSLVADPARAFVRLVRRDLQLAAGGYRLSVLADHVLLESLDDAGFWNGLLTLAGWMHASEGKSALPGTWIEDEPTFARRGAMLDISRDRIPTLEALFERIDFLARLKANHLELYLEHSFAYAGHESVHAGLSPLEPNEVRAIVAYAARRGIECVPNQNTFGHMHRWLRQPAYRHLAEEPLGSFHAFDYRAEPFSLCPTDPGSLVLVRDMLDQLLPLFPSPLFNGGLDETLDVGRGRSKAEAQRRGIGHLYGEYLCQVAALARKHGKRLAFWADILLDHPEAQAHLPNDSIAILWGYEADHRFDEQTKVLAALGREWWIAPGTSTWQSITGRFSNASTNIDQAIAFGSERGASGVLVTDWGDYGHWQPPLLSLPAFVRFFARAWNAKAKTPSEAACVDCWQFGGARLPLAEALMDLVQSTDALGDGARNGTGPFFAMRYPPHGPDPSQDWKQRAPTTSPDGLKAYAAALESVLERLAPWRNGEPQACAQIGWSARAGQFAAQLALKRWQGESLPAALIAQGRLLEQELRQLWLQTSRPGGLEDACRKWRQAWQVEP